MTMNIVRCLMFLIFVNSSFSLANSSVPSEPIKIYGIGAVGGDAGNGSIYVSTFEPKVLVEGRYIHLHADSRFSKYACESRGFNSGPWKIDSTLLPGERARLNEQGSIEIVQSTRYIRHLNCTTKP